MFHDLSDLSSHFAAGLAVLDTLLAALDTVARVAWYGNTPAGKAITVLIVVIGISSTWQARRHRIRYDRDERRVLEQARDRLRIAQDALKAERDATPSKSNVPMFVDLADISNGVPAESLIGDRLAALARMKQARVKVNVDALQQMTVLRESSILGLALPGYAVSIMMMLGLLGTFVGLSIMVQQLQSATPNVAGQVTAVDWEASRNSLGNIISGQKTAFSCTMIGLFCAIGVSWLNFRLAHAQSRFYDLLERFTIEELLPVTMPAVEDETALERFSAQLGESFVRLEGVTRDQAQSVEYLATVEGAFGTIIDNIRAITTQAAQAPEREASGALTGVIAQLTRVNGSLVDLTQQMVPALQSLRQDHERSIVVLTHALTAQQASLERVIRERRPASRTVLDTLFGDTERRVVLLRAGAGLAIVMLLGTLLFSLQR